MVFAILAIVGGALYWERKKIRSVLYEEDEFVTDFKKNLEEDKGTENVDYDKLGEDKVYTEQTGSVFDGFKFSFKDFNAEADRGIQIISLICLACLLIGPTQAWLHVEGVTVYGDETAWLVDEEFKANYFSDYWETESTDGVQAEELDENAEIYENPQCTDNVMKVYNCNYRSTLFGTMEQLLTLSALFCFIVFQNLIFL